LDKRQIDFTLLS